MNGCARLGGRPPEIGGVEAHAVERVGLLALAVGIRVREDERAVHGVDGAMLAARVAGQPRVSHRGVAPRGTTFARSEGRRRPRLTEVGARLPATEKTVPDLGDAVPRR